MSGRTTTILLLVLVVIVLVVCGVLLVDPFNSVASFSVVAQQGNVDASTLAVVVSQIMFAILVTSLISVTTWLCIRAVRRRGH